jgi:hypothetical protein
MAQIPVLTAVRLIPREADYLDRKSGTRGEVFFDNETKTLRLYDGISTGGNPLARSDLTNIDNATFAAKVTASGFSGGGSIEVSDAAPSSPDEGTIWFNSANAKIYVYVNDGTSLQWIQPVAPVPGSILDLGISDGTVGQILTTDGAGGFTFEDAPQGFDGEWSSLSNTPTTLAGYGITDASTFDGAFSSLTGKPTTVSGYGITDAQALLVSGTNIKTVNGTSLLGAGDVTISASTGNVTFTGYTIDTSDSAAISITPAVAMDSDLAVGNDLSVGQDATISVNLTVNNNATIQNDLTVGNNLIITGDFTSNGSGIPEIFSDNEIQLTAGTRVELTSSPIKMASFSTAERDLLVPQNGDIIYNSSTNKFQGYENGSWVNLI